MKSKPRRGSLAPEERVHRPNPATELVYGCGHARVEHRGQMSEALLLSVREECAGRPCPTCARQGPAKRRATLLPWDD
jgi:hypothetical protein